MIQKAHKTTELRHIRIALGLTQAEMMEALALDTAAQNTLSGYETNPKKKGYQQALERAKEVYKVREKKEWVTPGAADERGLGRLEGRIDEQGKEIARLRRRLGEAFALIQDLGRRAGIELPPQEPVE